ncbi:hypothetical protein GUJ93_ZPchr0004g39394 [Zizania palustris]|uniref:Uncharacterized protein n=1 Tax=Zizania palustris TaxID=103762 RepID=A0A8J5VYR1_ZIZPA|nr:hypothetical protein GUJ93_ZPchr0004g39394 [Zizania palustris]
MLLLDLDQPDLVTRPAGLRATSYDPAAGAAWRVSPSWRARRRRGRHASTRPQGQVLLYVLLHVSITYTGVIELRSGIAVTAGIAATGPSGRRVNKR